MRRIRLSTLMLLIVIAALVVALVMERQRSARLEKRLPKYMTSKMKFVPLAKAAAKPGGGRPPVVGIRKLKEGDER